MSEKSFCYLNGYAVKDQTARDDIELLKTGKVSNEGLAIAIETVNNSVDTVDGRVTSLSSRVDTISNTVNAHESATGIAYSGTASGLAAATVQAAIDELAADVSGVTPDSATGITYSGTASGLEATNVQAAIDELAADVDATIDGIVEDVTALENKFKDFLITLTAGSTDCTIPSALITTDSTIEIFTSVYGVNPESVTVTSGSITVVFEAQESDVDVKVRVS